MTLFLAPSLAESPLLRTHIHSHSTKPSVVWVPAYMIVIPDLTVLGLVAQRQSEQGQRCQRAQSHSLSASLLPFLPLSHSLARTCPARHPQNHSSSSLPRSSPLLSPVRSTPNGWLMSKHRQSSASTARLAASLQSQRAATLLGGACGRGRLWGL
ncbi:hypothetical protein QQF64_020774 [Cirrhinus molitorella]|uniref:Uncharacterized protein n=1 Tax=Cirrhinus molitorella TaxID=172907 RepID=A0ABR3LA40_9TELE